MECRASLLLALGLSSLVLGCTPQGTLPLVSSGSGEASSLSGPLGDGGHQKPHASTCVAAGHMLEKEAADPKQTPADREMLVGQASKAYQQAISTDSECLPAHLALAHLYETHGEPHQAVAAYRKVLEKHPKEASLWYELGMCHSRQKEWDQALAALRQAVELEPGNHAYATTLGFCLARCGHQDESIACFTKVVGAGRAHYNVARMLYHLKQDDQCKQHLRLALQADPQLAQARDFLAQVENGTAPPRTPVALGFDTGESNTQKRN